MSFGIEQKTFFGKHHLDLALVAWSAVHGASTLHVANQIALPLEERKMNAESLADLICENIIKGFQYPI